MTDLGWLDAIEALRGEASVSARPGQWGRLDAIADTLEAAVRERDAEIEDLRDEMSDMVRKDWPGLAAILEHCYPEDVFPTLEDDPSRDLGPRVVSLLRLLSRERAALARVEALAADFDGGQYNIICRLIRAALADPKETA